MGKRIEIIMRVLIGCEFSGIVREAFKAKGWDAWSCDILDSEIPGQHIKGNILDHLNENWDLGIFHPPCTYLTNAGVRHLHSVPSKNGVVTKIHGEERWRLMREACEFFNKLQNANIYRICVENPIPHKYARELIGNYTQLIQPWQFGHGETKATCLWLKNLPLLKPTRIVKGHKPKCHHSPETPNRWKERSRTYTGIAKAMAEQWGILPSKKDVIREKEEMIKIGFE